LAHQGMGWILRPLYQFQGPPDGAAPVSRVIFGPDGALYGATVNGGPTGGDCAGGLYLPGCGIVFKLTPPASICKGFQCNWSETQIYHFSYSDGSGPMGEIAFDPAGNLYGATMSGGTKNAGTVFELTPVSGDWTLTTLQTFTGADGSGPMNGVKLDSAGNVYGTTYQGTGNGEGTVFELTHSQTGWSLNILYAFPYDSPPPRAGVILDQEGNLYGSTCRGAVFELSPSNGDWTYDSIYNLSGTCSFADLTMDAAGNLYGTTVNGGSHGFGNVFKLTPSGGSWVYTDLYDFTGSSDGGEPLSNVVMDANGNLYGTASTGGSDNGVVWEITP
ncbi:MAG: choice-of-anchor tandem repeat GloVer-containing protein, partial [Candidatus Korobacteraceae bacterium]